MPKYGRKIQFKKVTGKGFSARKAINHTDAVARKLVSETKKFSHKTLY